MTGFTANTNWRFLLLATASIVLSVASGWTTWDGMSNFTQAAILSLLITFGIQSVMLISAWMLGEVLVNRFWARGSAGRRRSAMLWGVVALAVPFTFLVLDTPDIPRHIRGIFASGESKELLWIAGVLACAIAILWLLANLRRTSPNSVNPVRALFHAALLSFMFLACMAISVFFSFDSLFSSVFPDSERQRAAEIRTQSQVDGILNDVAANAHRELADARAHVLASSGWKDFEARLDALQNRLSNATQQLKLETSGLTQKSQETDRSQLERRAQFTAIRDSTLREESAAKALRNQTQSRHEELFAARTALEKQIFEMNQQVTAMEESLRVEEAGLGTSGTPGRGGQYRRLRADLQRLKLSLLSRELDRDKYDDRLAELAGTLAKEEENITRISVALSKMTGEVAALDGGTPERVALLEQQEQMRAVEKSMSSLLDARNTFIQDVSTASLETLAQHCDAAAAALLSTAQQEPRVSCAVIDMQRDIAPVEALVAGLAGLSKRCGSAATGKQAETTVDLSATRARECVQIAGLSSGSAQDLRRRIDDIERNRDDKAHRFIVTINAFADGNRLAYLALAIALCIDGLVFVSGLLGAATRVSPLARLPGASGHTVAGADRIMHNALLPHATRTASLALAAIRPLASAESSNGGDFTHRISMSDLAVAGVPEIGRVISAAAAIGAARRIDGPREVYALRREIVDFLALSMTGRDSDHEPASDSSARSARFVSALGNNSETTAQVVTRLIRPIIAENGFIGRISCDGVGENDLPLVIRALNAAAIADGARPEDTPGKASYLLHRDICEVLLQLAQPRTDETIAAEAPLVSQAIARDSTTLAVVAEEKARTVSKQFAAQASALRTNRHEEAAKMTDRPTNRSNLGPTVRASQPTISRAEAGSEKLNPVAPAARLSAAEGNGSQQQNRVANASSGPQAFSLAAVKLATVPRADPREPSPHSNAPPHAKPAAQASSTIPAGTPIRRAADGKPPANTAKTEASAENSTATPGRLKVSLDGDTAVFD